MEKISYIQKSKWPDHLDMFRHENGIDFELLVAPLSPWILCLATVLAEIDYLSC